MIKHVNTYCVVAEIREVDEFHQIENNLVMAHNPFVTLTSHHSRGIYFYLHMHYNTVVCYVVCK